MNSPVIGFAHKPSVANLSIETMEFTWIPKMDKSHIIFEQIDNVNGFDYYYYKDILIIPDPIPVSTSNQHKSIIINDLEIECTGSFVVFFHFNLIKGVIYADSLTFPEYILLKNNIECC
ncbi:hypothetical protein J14TS2_20990 [Bacillus sp. J14TS2]|uniref:hypothetical protein n=1 Tax=Bacillus sp. J14TS2 TaxID=2807188 RepID=UPI001B028BF5|nr:hypothetical protein [Bacillus sp. J14TS2]GIN71624.1 hypothetical protein J14TS2_20990 [Bacillus sp. J14TS2]